MRSKERIDTLERRCDELLDQLNRLRADLETAIKLIHETPAAIEEIKREHDQFRLDYEGLYDKARTTLAKLAKRARDAADSDDSAPSQQQLLARGRRLLAERKLRGA